MTAPSCACAPAPTPEEGSARSQLEYAVFSLPEFCVDRCEVLAKVVHDCATGPPVAGRKDGRAGLDGPCAAAADEEPFVAHDDDDEEEEEVSMSVSQKI